MKIEKQILEFVRLRIEGNSFDEIAKELNTAKLTLIEWNKKAVVRDSIVEGKAMRINTVVKSFEFDQQNRLKTHLVLSKRINDELAKRDLSDVPTEKLLAMSIVNDNRVKELVSKTIRIGEETNYFPPTHDSYFVLGLDE